MKAYIIFLRGVTPTGKNKVPMTPLRQVLAAAGLSDVRTYIQSGNVLVRSGLTASQVEKLVHDEIKKYFGGDLVVVARTPAQLRQIFKRNPFEGVDTAKTYFTILSNKPDESKVKTLVGQDFHPDMFVVSDKVVYVHCQVGYANTKLNNNFLEKKLGVSATTRNCNTMSKLIELSNAS